MWMCLWDYYRRPACLEQLGSSGEYLRPKAIGNSRPSSNSYASIYIFSHSEMEDKNNNDNNIAVKKLSALLRGITSKNNGNFYGLNCLCSFRKKQNKNKLTTPKKVCEIKDFCGIVMPSEEINILEFNQY